MKKTALLSGLLLIVLLLTTASITGAQDGSNTPPMRTDMQLYQGDGWWFFYPKNASLEMLADGSLRVQGPYIEFRHLTYDAIYQEPAYTIDVVVYPNPEGLFPEVFAEQLILAQWQEVNAAGGPNTLPVMPDGSSLDPTKVSTPIVNHYPAFKVEFFGGDGPIYRVYVGGGDPIVMFVYKENLLPNHPLALMQADMYTMITNTFGRAN